MSEAKIYDKLQDVPASKLTLMCSYNEVDMWVDENNVEYLVTIPILERGLPAVKRWRTYVGGV